jgi:riboflavin kinase/FMN adenylyltransferase
MQSDGSISTPLVARVASIGNFDGLHVGHAAILAQVVKEARASATMPTVVTFEPHSLAALRPALAPPRLTPASPKRRLLQDFGIESVVTLEPDEATLSLSAEAFYGRLRDAGVRHFVEGSRFVFGRGRSGNTQTLAEWCRRDGLGLTVIGDVDVTLDDSATVAVSSSLVRWLLLQGRVRDAARCLGRPYRLTGVVVTGDARGRTIGFPTANLDCGPQLVPGEGVYAAIVGIGGRSHPVALSVGTKPTFDGSRLVVEAHVLGFSGDLYGLTLDLDLLAWVRDQMPFPALHDLTDQLKRDCAWVEREIPRVLLADARTQLDINGVHADR